MIKVSYDSEANAVVVSFEGNVDDEQAQRALAEVEQALPKDQRGFTVLVDYSGVDTLEPEVEREVLKAMDFLNAHGVTEVVRVLPDPALDLGFTLMSRVHYSKGVQIHNVRTRAQAQAYLHGGTA